MSHITSARTKGPNVITDRTFIALGFQMLLQMGPLLHLGPVIRLVLSTEYPPFPGGLNLETSIKLYSQRTKGSFDIN